MTGYEALLKSLIVGLSFQGAWQGRVYNDFADANAAMPYLLIYPMSLTVINERLGKDDFLATMVLEVVSTDSTVSATGAGNLSAILDNRGGYDSTNPFGLVAGAGWNLLTITKLGYIHIAEKRDQTTDVFHDGFEFEFRMEAI